MKLRVHFAVSSGVAGSLAVALGLPPLESLVAAVAAPLADYLIDELGHTDILIGEKKQPIRRPLTHWVTIAPFWGLLAGLTVSSALAFASAVFAFRFGGSLLSSITVSSVLAFASGFFASQFDGGLLSAGLFGGLCGSLCHLLLDSLADSGVYLRGAGNGRWYWWWSLGPVKFHRWRVFRNPVYYNSGRAKVLNGVFQLFGYMLVAQWLRVTGLFVIPWLPDLSLALIGMGLVMAAVIFKESRWNEQAPAVNPQPEPEPRPTAPVPAENDSRLLTIERRYA